MPATLFPIFLKLENRSCLVIGGGGIASSKISSLLEAGATVTVVAPRACDQVEQYAVERRIRWIQREYEPADLEGVFLAVAATSEPEVNCALYEEAGRRGVICNSVDDPPHCDFYFPAVVRRGDLQIAISTGGQSPALARRLRCELEEALDLSLSDMLLQVGEMRRRILEHYLPSEERGRLLKLLAYRDACDAEDCPARKMVTANVYEQR